MGNLAPPKANPDEQAIETMNMILGGDFTSRINMNLREDKHWSYAAFTFFRDARGQRPFAVYAPVQTDKTAESVAEVQKELRGIVGESLTPEVAVRYAAAFAETLPPGSIVVTRDGRATGAMLADAVRSALLAMGRGVIDAHIASTPTTGVLVRQFQAAGGMQISASHNPAPYNGLKLFSSAGRVMDAQAGEGRRLV